MNIVVRLRGIERSPSVVEYATRRARQHLGRFGTEVSAVTVRVSDVNGPKGGADKRCQLTVAGPRIGAVNLAEMHEDVFAGMDLALDRVAHVIGRSLDRARELQGNGEARSAT